ncbi:tetratricopeptide repeat protein [Aquisalibacillus elongatus]|uniref:Tetratricopeptide repeat protein n=1 Tax=Aquisalibacillus elongatus TaxID=485577 RepID=A0A3N5BJI3_9BACI|nr:tetratricopeptide repeat protein [Aquisalibacillus elongatus]RPF55450.1 tetratricopeptide repeat protein [Aquisalibacillus elongatus]
MEFEHHDVVMFPGWRKELESKSFEAVKHKNYEEALLHIEQLESFREASNDILTAKVICLIELNRYEQAISLCRKLMKEDDEHYYKYLHIYLTILFQTSQYSELVDLLDEIKESSTIPWEYEDAFKQLYDMSKQFQSQATEQESEDHMNHFLDSLENGNFQEQWKLLSFHRNHSIKPYLDQLIPYLSDSQLNPVIKTGIIQWCMEDGVDRKVEVEKFGQTDWVSPNSLRDVLETDFAIKGLRELEEVEQSDPTLYQFTKQILFRYLYINFPFTPEIEQSEAIAQAVLNLAKRYLNLDSQNEYITKDSQKWMNEIEHLEKIYFSQVED